MSPEGVLVARELAAGGKTGSRGRKRSLPEPGTMRSKLTALNADLESVSLTTSTLQIQAGTAAHRQRGRGFQGNSPLATPLADANAAGWSGLPSTAAQRRAAIGGACLLLVVTVVVLRFASQRGPVAPVFLAMALTFAATASALTGTLLLSPFIGRRTAGATLLGMVYYLWLRHRHRLSAHLSRRFRAARTPRRRIADRHLAQHDLVD